MKEQLITILETFGFPVRLQGSLAPDEAYPESFFTFWNASTADGAYYNDAEHKTVWNFDINFYSVSPDLVNTALVQAKTALKANGWIVSGKGYDVVSDEPTHTGRGMQAIFIER